MFLALSKAAGIDDLYAAIRIMLGIIQREEAIFQAVLDVFAGRAGGIGFVSSIWVGGLGLIGFELGLFFWFPERGKSS